MVHIDQYFIGIKNDLMAAFAFDMRYKTDAAAVMFVLRIVKSDYPEMSTRQKFGD
jgi:hypothetical protein